MTHPLNAHQLK